MVVTVEWMRANYNKYNKILFGGKLPEIEFVINNRMKCYGIANFRYKVNGVRLDIIPLRIQMTSYRESDERYHLGTLVHEMIHIEDYTFHPEHYVYEVGYGRWRKNKSYNSHGNWFLSEAERINSMNLGFEITVRETTEEKVNTALSAEYQKKYENEAKKGYFVTIRERSKSWAEESGNWGDIVKLDKDTFNKELNYDENQYKSGWYRKHISRVYYCICHSPEIGPMRRNSSNDLPQEKLESYLALSEVIKTVVIPSEAEVNEKHMSIVNTMANLFNELYGERKKKGRFGMQIGAMVSGVDPLTNFTIEVKIMGNKFYIIYKDRYGKFDSLYPEGMNAYRRKFSSPSGREEIAKEIAANIEKRGLKLESMKTYKQIIRETLENYIANDSNNGVKVSGVPGQRMYEKEISDGEGEFAVE